MHDRRAAGHSIARRPLGGGLRATPRAVRQITMMRWEHMMNDLPARGATESPAALRCPPAARRTPLADGAPGLQSRGEGI